MRILLYEFITGGGLFSWNVSPQDSDLLSEGRAMAWAMAQDLSALPNISLTVLEDARVPPAQRVSSQVPVTALMVSSAADEQEKFFAAASQSDAVLVIAPETNHALLTRTHCIEKAATRNLGASVEFVRLTADKHQTAEVLAQAGVPAPRGLRLEFYDSTQLSTQRPTFPAVLKPLNACGSEGVCLVETPQRLTEIARTAAFPLRLEPFHPGLAVSISVLAGPAGAFFLPPSRQLLSQDGHFAYLGGELPLSPPLAARASALARRAVAALPPARGFFGIDLVLGDDRSGAEDVIIEVNPRLTTSYVGLRALAKGNLAAALLAVLAGDTFQMEFSSNLIQFSADGRLQP